MSLFVLIKLFASLVTGMLGIPIGMLPSVLFFRDLANGVDVSEASKASYARVLWGGMLAGWLVGSVVAWLIISFLFA
ncbi:MAG: hypothetical protein ABJM29_17715 [Rhizobiaceae bacterium]